MKNIDEASRDILCHKLQLVRFPVKDSPYSSYAEFANGDLFRATDSPAHVYNISAQRYLPSFFTALAHLITGGRSEAEHTLSNKVSKRSLAKPKLVRQHGVPSSFQVP